MASMEFQFLDFSQLENQDYQNLQSLLDSDIKKSDIQQNSESLNLKEPECKEEIGEVTIYNELCKDFISISKENSGGEEISFFVDGGSAEDAVGTPPMLIAEERMSEIASPCIDREEMMCMNEHTNVYEDHSTPITSQAHYVNQQHMGHPPVHSMPANGPPLSNVPPQYSFPQYGAAPVPNAMYGHQIPSSHPMVNPTVYVENCHVNFSPYGSPQPGPMYQSHPQYGPSPQQLYQSYLVADPNIPANPMQTAHDKMDYEHKRHELNRGVSRGRGSRGRGRKKTRDDSERSNSVSSDHSSYSDSGNKPIFKEAAVPPQNNAYPPMFGSYQYPLPYPVNQMPRPLIQHQQFAYDPYNNQQALLAYHHHHHHPGVSPANVAPTLTHEPMQPHTECEQFNQDQATTIAHHATYISTSVVTQQAAPTSNHDDFDEGISLEIPTGPMENEEMASFDNNETNYSKLPTTASTPIENKTPESPIIETEIKEEMHIDLEKSEISFLGSKINSIDINEDEIKVSDPSFVDEISIPCKANIEQRQTVTDQEAVQNTINDKKSLEFTTRQEIPIPDSLKPIELKAKKNVLPKTNKDDQLSVKVTSGGSKHGNGKESSAFPIINTKVIRKSSKEVTPIATFGSFSDDCLLQDYQECVTPTVKKVSIPEESEDDVANNHQAKQQKSALGKESAHQAAKAIASNIKELPEAAKPDNVPVVVAKEIDSGPLTETAWGKKKSWSQLFKPNDDSSNKQIAYVSPFNSKMDDKDEINSSSKMIESLPSQYSDCGEEKAKVGVVLSSYEPDYRPVQLQPRGLINKNYWCYVNAPLQALLACPSFYQVMMKLSKVAGYKAANVSTPFINSIVDFCDDFSTVGPVNQSKKEKKEPELSLGSPFEPTCVYKMLTNSKDNQFTEGRQQDAEEMLSFVLNGLHDEMVEAMKLANGNPVVTNGNAHTVNVNSEQLDSDDENEWKVQGPKKKSCVTRTAHFNPSPISQIFWGRLRSVLQHNGGNTTAYLQPFNSLPLDIQSPKVDTLKDALSQLVTREEITGFTCPKTNQEVTASNQVMLEDLPRVLILQLKRFIYDKDGGLQKVTKRLQFPIDLEITKDLISSNSRGKFSSSQRKFKLFAIVNHEGKEATKGHYVADIFHTGYNSWIRYDDASVKALPETAVLRHEPPRVPYLLFYRRSDTLFPTSGSAHFSNGSTNSKQTKS